MAGDQPGVRERISRMVQPLWLTYALLILGFAFVVSTPLGVGGDVGWYVLAIVFAFAAGLFFDRKVYRMTILEQSERGWLIRIERRRYKGRGERSAWE